MASEAADRVYERTYVRAYDRTYLDHRVFLGLNAADEGVRRRCKALVAARMKSVTFMTFDQVGRCDDIIWRFNRRFQLASLIPRQVHSGVRTAPLPYHQLIAS